MQRTLQELQSHADIKLTLLLNVILLDSQQTLMILFDVFRILDQKQLENVEYFNYLGSMITNDARCTREIKSSTATGKAAFNKKKTLFTSKLDLKVKEETSKVLHLEHSFVWC
jgi:hypothetical protein